MQSISSRNHYSKDNRFPGSSRQNEVLIPRLLDELGSSCSSDLGINLASLQSDEVFKWFLASVLLGVNIRHRVAIQTYHEFEKDGLLSPERLLTTDCQVLVDILNRGGYVIYNFKTATGLTEAAGVLDRQYQGDLNRLHFFASDEKDLEKRLGSLGERVTPGVVKFFLREMRGLWEKAEPPLAKDVLLALERLQLADIASPVLAMEELRIRWEDSGINQTQFSVLETALMKLGRSYCRKMKCDKCPMKIDCRAVA